MEELSNLKSKVQELILEKDESIKYNEEWSIKHEAEVLENGAPKKSLQNRMKKLKERENEKKAEGDQTGQERLQQRYDEEKRLKGELNQKTIF